MSRAIKFRIWDKKHKRWFHGGTDAKSIALQTDAIDLFGEVIIFGEILYDQHEDDVWKNDKDIKCSFDILEWLEPCQFTGLYDKNERPIYEGDILETCCGKAEVYFDDELLMYRIKTRHGGTMPLVSKKSKRHFDYEVIGEIHENEELLEDKE